MSPRGKEESLQKKGNGTENFFPVKVKKAARLCHEWGFEFDFMEQGFCGGTVGQAVQFMIIAEKVNAIYWQEPHVKVI